MKRKKPYLLAGLVLLLFLLCTACGNTEGQIAPQDDPNEGLGGGLSEDTVNDFSGFEGIWLGEAAQTLITEKCNSRRPCVPLSAVCSLFNG